MLEKNEAVGCAEVWESDCCEPISRMWSSSRMEVRNSLIVHSPLPWDLARFCLIFPGSLPRIMGTNKLPYDSSAFPSAERLRIWLSVVS